MCDYWSTLTVPSRCIMYALLVMVRLDHLVISSVTTLSRVCEILTLSIIPVPIKVPLGVPLYQERVLSTAAHQELGRSQGAQDLSEFSALLGFQSCRKGFKPHLCLHQRD
jgi:hypothetical protein